MMDKLINPPSCVEIDGESYKINTDFKVWAEIEKLMFCDFQSENIRLAKILALAYPTLPHNPIGALEKIVYFYRGGEETNAQGEGRDPAPVPLYCIKQDFKYIYAAFLSEFGIDLCTENMHWWHFRALVSALGDDTMFAKIVRLRASNPAEIKDKEIRQRHEKYKKMFALQLSESEETRAARLAKCIEGLF